MAKSKGKSLRVLAAAATAILVLSGCTSVKYNGGDIRVHSINEPTPAR